MGDIIWSLTYQGGLPHLPRLLLFFECPSLSSRCSSLSSPRRAVPFPAPPLARPRDGPPSSSASSQTRDLLGFPWGDTRAPRTPGTLSPKFHRGGDAAAARRVFFQHLVRPHSSLCVPLFRRPDVPAFFRAPSPDDRLLALARLGQAMMDVGRERGLWELSRARIIRSPVLLKFGGGGTRASLFVGVID